MKKLIIFALILVLSNSFFVCVAEEDVKKKKSLPVNMSVTKTRTVNPDKDFTKVKKEQAPPKVTWSGEDEIELIPVNVRNEFDEEIKVKFDTNREYPIGPNEGISLGKRKPGRYTLTIYNKKGEFIDNVTRRIDKNNKFVLNKNTVQNADKITGLSTGQKVAITAGAIGAAAIGTALINKALQENKNQAAQEQYIPPPVIQEPAQVAVKAPVGAGFKPDPTETVDLNNAFAKGGKFFKIINTAYDQLTVIVEGADGNPIGNNWVIPKVQATQKPQPLIFNGEKITINSNQKVTVVLPNGFELVRYAFELDTDVDGSFIWNVNR